MFHFNNQLLAEGNVKLFKGSHGYADGEQQRDFIFVDDVIDVNLWLMAQPEVSGIFNVGTASARTFNEAAQQVIKWHGRGDINYIPFPDKLLNSYQSYTQADISSLRAAGYEKPFTELDKGVGAYLDWLNSEHN